MDVNIIDMWIDEILNSGNINPDICSRLANLYTIRDHLVNNTDVTEMSYNDTDNVEKEIDDILPAYREYVDIKTRFQKNEITDAPVRKSINNVCNEISELILVIYRNSDTPQERQSIAGMIDRLSKEITC